MDIYTYLCYPETAILNQAIDINSIIQQADMIKEQKELLHISISAVTLKYRLFINGKDIDIIEVDMSDYQYFFFAPSMIFKAIENQAVLFMRVNGLYKICLNCNSNGNLTPIFTGIVDLENITGRIAELLDSLKFDSKYAENIENIILKYKAQYISLPKLKHMVFYLLGKLSPNEKKQIESEVTNICLKYKYRSTDHNKHYMFLFDVDQLWSYFQKQENYRRIFTGRKWNNFLEWLDCYENYRTREVLEYRNIDISDFFGSNSLHKSDWYRIDFQERKKKTE